MIATSTRRAVKTNEADQEQTLHRDERRGQSTKRVDPYFPNGTHPAQVEDF
jgi:hypothetical protein